MQCASQQLPQEVFEQIAGLESCNSERSLKGCEIRPQPSFRGATRVWTVRDNATGNQWYVKKVENRDIYHRYIHGAPIFASLENQSSLLRAVEIAGSDAGHLMIATGAVPGLLASTILVDSARYDRVFSWRAADLKELGRRVAAALCVVWSSSGPDPEVFENYMPAACASQIDRKFERLSDVAPAVHEKYKHAIAQACGRLRKAEYSTSFLIGDVDLANMLFVDGQVCFFDLDDLGYGDRRRDMACLLYRLDITCRNWKYSRLQIKKLRQRLLARTGIDRNDPIIGMYQVEFVIDALWSALRHREDKNLPVHGQSPKHLESELGFLLMREG